MVRGDNQIMSLEILSIALGKHVLLLCARALCDRVLRQDCRALLAKLQVAIWWSGLTTPVQKLPRGKVSVALP